MKNEHASIQALLSDITVQEFPEEKDTYEIFEADMIPQLMAGKDIAADSGAHNEFLGTAGQIINSISVAAATIKTILEVRKLLKVRKEKDVKKEVLREYWLKTLLEEEVGKETAERVIAKYQAQLEKIIAE